MALTIGLLTVAFVDAILFARKPLVLIAVLIPFLVVFTGISARTTSGDWRWRWGDEN